MSPRARWTPADIGEPHVVAACWALLTGSYGAHILSLWMTHAQPPGLSTVTAAGAVMAVWLYFPIHYRSRLRPGPPRAFRRPRAALLMVLALVVISSGMPSSRTSCVRARSAPSRP